jgi:hypothetical protein
MKKLSSEKVSIKTNKSVVQITEKVAVFVLDF